jgi:UDP-N-acetylmuramate--alanine ligase
MNSPFRGLSRFREVYFIGIGGIGMSALARFFREQGVAVSGYDKTETALTRELAKEGIAIHYEENLELIPKNPDLVIYTPAIPKDHQEWLHYQQSGAEIVKRSDVLQMITHSSFNICVAGTHGKTTISTMVAHLLRHSGFGCNAFLGGISVNYGSNFWSHERNVSVIEADEYDRTFLKLQPDIAIVSAMDADHLDIYGTAEEVESAYIEFTRKLRAGGRLIAKHGMKRSSELRSENYISYACGVSEADVFSDNIRMHDGAYSFDCCLMGHRIQNLHLNMGGLHNVENMTAAIAAAWLMGVEEEKIREAVEAFRGVKRRFEYVYRSEKWIVVDDYAHHPEELRALLEGARSLFADRKLLLCFQPHLFSRTRDFADDFAEVMNKVDELVLLPIYPARELPMEGVSSEMILERMREMPKQVLSKQEMLNWVKKRKNDSDNYLLVMAGAGDIDKMMEPVKEILEN